MSVRENSLPSTWKENQPFEAKRKEMEMHLRKKELWETVNENQGELDPNDKKKAEAFSDIIKCLTRSAKDMFGVFDDVPEAWTMLLRAFSKPPTVRKVETLKELENLKLINESVTKTIYWIKARQNEYVALGGIFPGTEVAERFIQILSRNYTEFEVAVRTEERYQSMGEIDIEKVLQAALLRSVVLDARQVRKKVDEEIQVLKVTPTKRGCWNCGDFTHMNRDCPKCEYCKEEGDHKRATCPKLKKRKAEVNVASTEIFQCNIIRRDMDRKYRISLLLESVASNHCCSDLSLLHNVEIASKFF